MTALRYSAYGAFALAVLVAMGAAVSEAVLLLGGSVSAGLIGLLLLAADRALTYLREIRDHLVGGTIVEEAMPASETPDPEMPVQSLQEIDQDIRRLRARAERA
ncbi:MULTISPECIES: hypothetical protein [unclassified Marinovum]